MVNIKTIIKEQYNVVRYKPYYKIDVIYNHNVERLTFKGFNKQDVLNGFKEFIINRDMKCIINAIKPYVSISEYSNGETETIVTKTIKNTFIDCNKSKIIVNKRTYSSFSSIIDFDNGIKYIIVVSGNKYINESNNLNIDVLTKDFKKDVDNIINKN